MASSISKTPARRRNRTFTGCLTCRKRKVKCTEGPLPCGNCRRLELECVSPFTKNLRPVTQYSKAKTSSVGSSDSNDGNSTFFVNENVPSPPRRKQRARGCIPAAASSGFEPLHLQVPPPLNCQDFTWLDGGYNDPLSAVSDESFFSDPQFVMAPEVATGGVMGGGTVAENGVYADDLNFDLHQQPNFYSDHVSAAYYSDGQGYSPHAVSPSHSHETFMSSPDYSAWLPEAANQGQFHAFTYGEQNGQQPLQWM